MFNSFNQSFLQIIVRLKSLMMICSILLNYIA